MLTQFLFGYFKKSEVSSTSITLNEREKANKKACSKDIDEDEDISTALEREIDHLRMEYKMPLPSRKFQVC